MKRFIYRSVFNISLILCVTLLKADRPNIILFITDDQSSFTWDYGDYIAAKPFGFNGDKTVYTPEIDRLAKEGMIFTRAYVSSSVCSPSRYTTLTGRYAGRNTGKVFMHLHPEGTMTRVENSTELEDDRLNVAKVLKTNGYRTGFVGKSHVVDHDALNRHAEWEKKYGLKQYTQDDDPTDPEISAKMKHNHEQWQKRIARHGFDYVDGVYSANLRELFNKKANVHNVEWTTRAALNFIKSSKNQPFFLYYATTTPHGPAPWIDIQGEYAHGLHADPNITGEGYMDYKYPFMPKRGKILQIARENGAKYKDAWLTWIDCSIGAIRKQLETQGILDNTLIIITSDHGAWRHGKTTLHEAGLRVPLAMHWPKAIKPGSVYDEMVQNIDYVPTILDIAGIKAPKELDLDGVSLKKVLKGSKKPVHDYLFGELGYSRAVFSKDWKYIAVRYDDAINKQIEEGKKFNGFHGEKLDRPYLTRNGHLGYHASAHNPHYFETDQLYNINSDPKEEENIYASHPEKAKELKKRLTHELNTFANRPFGEFTD